MTITKDIAAKFAVAIVAVSMVLSAFAPVAKAQTTEDLQKMINDLLAQVAALQAKTGQGGTSVASGICPYTWTRDLAVGATGADVMKLQQFLNADADTRVAASGAGSVGMETEYYGPATAAAVSKMQVKYRADILSPSNLVNPTGYFGASSRAKANSLCVTAPVVTPGDEDATDEDEDEDNGSVTLRGEASLDKMEIDSADDDQIEEGAEDAPVAEVTVEFADGDAEISRIDIALVADAANAEKDPWDVFETVSLWVDGDKVAETNADDEDDYLNEDDGSLRFSGLDIVAMEDEEVEITVAVNLQNNLDGMPEEWKVSVEALRFFDADGVASTETKGLDFTAPVTFTIEEAGYEDEIIVKTSTNDPDGTTLQVEDDSKSDWYTVFVFDLDTDDSINDISIDSIKVNVDTTVASFDTLVDDAELVIDGVTIDDYSVSLATTTIPGDTAVLTFNVDGDVEIDAGDRVEAELMLRFKSLTSGNEGATIKASISPADDTIIDAEGADDLGDTQLSGSATGDVHTLRTKGISVELDTTSAVVTVVDGDNNDYGTFKLAIDVTAFEQDVRISTNPANSVLYSLIDGAGLGAAASGTVTMTSSGEEVGGYFEINEGETETLTIEVTYVGAAVGAEAVRLQLRSLTFDETGTVSTADDETWAAVPSTDYRTAVVTIVN